MIGLAEVLRDWSLEATCIEKRGSAAANPRPRSGERRKREGRRTVGELREVVEDEEVVGMSESVVGDAAEAIEIGRAHV